MQSFFTRIPFDSDSENAAIRVRRKALMIGPLDDIVNRLYVFDSNESLIEAAVKIRQLIRA